jgi:hypothetical protein
MVGRSVTAIAVAAVGAGCAMALAVWRSLRHASPAVDLAAVRILPMWSSCLALLAFSAAHGAMLLSGVLLLTTVWGMPPALAGICLSPGPIVVAIVSLTMAGRLIGKAGIGVVAAVGAALYAVGIGIWLCAHRWGAGSAVTNTARPDGHGVGHHRADDDLPAWHRPRRGPARMGVRRFGRRRIRAHRRRAGDLLEACCRRPSQPAVALGAQVCCSTATARATMKSRSDRRLR